MIFKLTLSSKEEAKSHFEMLIQSKLTNFRGKQIKGIGYRKKKVWIECEDDS